MLLYVRLVAHLAAWTLLGADTAAVSTATAFIGTPQQQVAKSRSWGSRPARWIECIPRGGSDGTEDDSSSGSSSSGGDSSTTTYASELESIKSTVLRSVNQKLEELRRQIVDSGAVVENFGSTADQICNQALEAFAASAPPATNTVSSAAFDAKLSELEAAVDAPLHVLYLKLLGYMRENALQSYRAGGTTYEAMVKADADFVRQASAATRDGSDEWDWSQERSFLQAVMSLAADAGQKATDVQLNAATQQQTAMAFLQSQQQMIQQLQSQLYGQTSPWNIGMAYRIPDTNFNLQGSYQQGRANVQLSCVPDEYAPFLGPNGFTSGVGPGNLGLSLNLSI